jgi:hypothetical protein
MQSTGELPKAPTAKVTIEQLRDQCISKMESGGASHETIRQHKVLFRQLIAFPRRKQQPQGR